MTWKRVRNLIIGCIGGALVFGLLVINCIQQSRLPVITQLYMGLPYKMNDQPLVIHGMTAYEGIYMEDASDRDVADVAAIMVENVGEDMLTDANIAVYSDNACFLFYAQSIPPGEKTVILERNGQNYTNQRIISCWASAKNDLRNSLMDHSVLVKAIGMDTLELSNMSDEPLYDLSIYHKTWSKEIGAYLGGISYVTHVDKLEPGQLLLIKPDHYAYGYSKVISITNAGPSQ